MGLGHRMARLPDGVATASAGREAVFVQVARAMSYDSGRLTLVDLAPSTIYVTVIRPGEVGYLPTGEFLDRWMRWQHAHRDDRTHGVLSLLDADSRVAGDAHLLLAAPRIQGSGLAYRAELIRGVLPSTSGACVLSIEPHWEPEETVAMDVVRGAAG